MSRLLICRSQYLFGFFRRIFFLGAHMTEIRRDLARNALAILCILGLIALSLWVLQPFLAAGVWALSLVVATWPLFRALEGRLGGRRSLAVVLMSLALLLLLVLPLALAVELIVDHAAEWLEAVRKLGEGGMPVLPPWVVALPVLGERLAGLLQKLTAGGGAALVAEFTPHAATAGRWLLGQVGGLGGMLVQFVLMVLIAAVMFAQGEAGALLVRRLGCRLAGEQGEKAVILAAQAVRGVALGVGVTAIVQTVLGGLGLAAAGIPMAAFLSAVMLMLCIAQVGPLPILLPAAGWLIWQGDHGSGGFLLAWSLIVASLDNFLRPMLIRRGADLPLLLIFAGVIGGLLGFGLIGLFVGPVALAVTWTLMQAWLAEVPTRD